MTLAQKVSLMIFMFIINHWSFFIIAGITIISGWEYYNRFLRINKNTDSVDLMKRFMENERVRELKRRYKHEVG